MSTPQYGLLLDVDGPICSPASRNIDQPSIVPDMLTLMQVGIPLVFNTGRSAGFLINQVFRPLEAAGLPPASRIHGVCEKGGVWLTLTGEGSTEEIVDESVAPPPEFPAAIEALVNEKYSSHMFFDHTKLAMVSVEQIVGVTPAEYYEAQKAFDEDAFNILVEMGIGVEFGERHSAPKAERPVFRIDPTIISTDIESVVLGKDFGAQRALQLLAEDGALPKAWRTVGDSRSDYKMADWLHAQGHEVAHVDVRPADGVPEKPYPIMQAQSSVNDEAGAKWLSWLVTHLGADIESEAEFDS